MSFPAYELYADSGDNVLGEVPSHWDVTRLGFLSDKIGSGKTPKGGSETYVDDGVLFIRSQNVYDDGLHLDDVVYITDEVDEEMSTSRVETGDILLNITGASLGRTCLVPDEFQPANVNQHVCIVRMSDHQHREYVAMVLKAFLIKSQIDACQNGAAREGLNFEQIGRLRLALPPLDEQKAISSFLDVETSKIDGLVSEQRRLIELLKEKRQAVISHAVTKGLNPNAPMKPSGIQWLGDVPQHWTLHQLRRLVTKFVDYRGRTPTKTDSGVPLITAGAIRNGVIDHTRCPEYIAESDYDDLMSRGLPELGDVVITTEAPLGEVAQVDDPSVAFAQRVILFKGNKKRMLPDFMRYWYLSINGRDELFSRSSGSTASGIRADRLKRSLVPTPPITEQQEIVGYLEPLLERLLAPVAEAERAIELLQERRTALISAAVTGKIDVRELVPKEAVA